MTIIKVSNPYFKRDFLQSGNQIIWKDTGVWISSWEETKRIGLKKSIQFQKREFKTKKEASNFTSQLIKEMF